MDAQLIVAIIGTVVMPLLLFVLNRQVRPVNTERALGDREVESVHSDTLVATKPPVTSAKPTSSDLTFERIPRYSRYKGYRPAWHRGTGDYESGRDFLWLEYECGLSSPKKVAIQVEGPKYVIQPDLCDEKVALVERVLEQVQSLSINDSLNVEPGTRTRDEAVRDQKSTSVFTVPTNVPTSSTPEETAKQAIEVVHALLGPALDRAWKGGP